MAIIYYDNGEDTYRIDEISQRFLMYLHMNGETSARRIIGPVGVERVDEIHYRVSGELGPEKANFVTETRGAGAAVEDGARNGASGAGSYELTSDGVDFIQEHHSRMTTPIHEMYNRAYYPLRSVFIEIKNQ